MLSDDESIDMLIGNADANSIERELQKINKRSLEANRDQNPNDRIVGSSS